MLKNIINRVTVTGADDSVRVEDLVEIQKEYPFVEWGILLSKSSEGRPRFPSVKWIEDLWRFDVATRMANRKNELKLSGHLCGKWVRDICAGKKTLYEDRPQLDGLFGRYQLNFHSYLHGIKNKTAFAEAVNDLNVRQIILQFDDVNNPLLRFVREVGIDAVPLFDTSGGAGVLPGSWPKALDGYCGYAGGLSPENLAEQMKLVSQVCGDGPIWIDAETRLRSSDNRQFDLEKVCRFLDEAKPWLEEGKAR